MISLPSRERAVLILHLLDIVFEVTSSGAACFRKSTFDGERSDFNSTAFALLFVWCTYHGSGV